MTAAKAHAPSALVLLAEGFEEIEAVTVIDLLRRAGVEVRTAALHGRRATGSHRITLEADAELDDLQGPLCDIIVLPGGMPGAEHLKQDARVISLLQRYAAADRYVAAICAAPGVLAQAGLLDGRRATSYPGFLGAGAAQDVRLETSPVVVDGRIVTSRGPGTAMDFALSLIELLQGQATRAEVEGRLLRPG
jgi:4-methyl-5(b-hydroxyethyl)-thiazole monophosphate biosynthesis